jgi:hypothetical protein
MRSRADDCGRGRGPAGGDRANAPCLSLRTTTEALAREILDAWFAEHELDPAERVNVARLDALNARM